jgi:hypothetical protein
MASSILDDSGHDDNPYTDTLAEVALQAHLRSLLDGTSPNGTPAEKFGSYRDIVAQLGPNPTLLL